MPVPIEELGRAHLVEEDEGADHLPPGRGQRAAHLEAAEVAGARHDHLLDGVAGAMVARLRIFGGGPAHLFRSLARAYLYRCCNNRAHMKESEMPGSLEGKVAIVTGVSHDGQVGQAVAKALAAQGASLAICARTQR